MTGWAIRTYVTTSTSLTLRALFNQAAARAGLDRRAAVTAGLTPAAKALAAVAQARTHASVTLLVVPTDKDVEQLTSDARFFYAAMEGASEATVEQSVLPLPSLQVDPYRGMSPHFRVAAARARALYGAITGTARLGNDADGIFGGVELVEVTGDPASGLVGTVTLAV